MENVYSLWSHQQHNGKSIDISLIKLAQDKATMSPIQKKLSQ